MKINNYTLPLAYLLRAIGKRAVVKGWNRVLTRLFPLQAQSHFPLSFSFSRGIYHGYADSYIDRMAFFYGAYEKPLLQLLEKFVTLKEEPCTFVDVGANVGHHSLYLSYCCARVHAFEPLPNLQDEIRNKIRRNGVNNITLHGCGLGDEKAQLPFNLPATSNLGQGSFVADQVDGSAQPHATLPVEVGDSYFVAQGIGPVDIIKIDVEGFEPNVLRGLRQTLDRDRPLVVVELSELNRSQLPTGSALLALLPPGYTVWRLRRKDGIAVDYELRQVPAGADIEFFGNVICQPKNEVLKA